MRKTLGIALVAIMLVTLTLACGPTPTPQVIREKETVVVTEKETVVVEKEPGEQTVVEFWTTDNEKARMDVQNELATRFEEANPDIDIQVVAIDEAQFFDHSLVAICICLANEGYRVIVAGLDMDSDGNPFGPMPHLMAVAEDVEKLHAVCVKCGEDASFSYHKGQKAGQVEVGADQYEARCRACWRTARQST